MTTAFITGTPLVNVRVANDSVRSRDMLLIAETGATSHLGTSATIFYRSTQSAPLNIRCGRHDESRRWWSHEQPPYVPVLEAATKYTIGVSTSQEARHERNSTKGRRQETAIGKNRSATHLQGRMRRSANATKSHPRGGPHARELHCAACTSLPETTREAHREKHDVGSSPLATHYWRLNAGSSRQETTQQGRIAFVKRAKPAGGGKLGAGSSAHEANRMTRELALTIIASEQTPTTRFQTTAIDQPTHEGRRDAVPSGKQAGVVVATGGPWFAEEGPSARGRSTRQSPGSTSSSSNPKLERIMRTVRRNATDRCIRIGHDLCTFLVACSAMDNSSRRLMRVCTTRPRLTVPAHAALSGAPGRLILVSTRTASGLHT